MAERNQDDWGPLAPSYAAPPSVRPNAPSSKSPTSQVPYYMEPIIGFKNELAGAIQIAKNVTGVIESAAKKLSEKTGQDFRVSFEEIRGAMEEAQQSLAEDAPGTEGSPARALLRGVGAAPVQFLEYGIPALLTKKPTAVFALVDAAREADKGWAAAGKAAAIGAAGGFAQGQIAKIPSLLARSGAGALVGGAQAKLQGGAPEDIVASALMGGGFSALAHEKIPDVRRGPDGQPVAFTVREPKPDVKPGVSWFESPHLKFEHVPGAADVVTDVINGTARIEAINERWNVKAREAFYGKGLRGKGGLTPAERTELINYLDDPKYDATNIPKASPKIQEAFLQVDDVRENIRAEILKLKREQWIDERAEPPEAAWAQERQRLGRVLTPQEAEAFRAQRRAGLDQAAQKAIPDFGRRGYFPRMFEGDWKTVYIDKNGQEKPIEIGGWLSETRRDAEIKAEQYALTSGLPRNKIVVAEYEPNLVGADHNRTTGKRFFGNVEQRGAHVDVTGLSPDQAKALQHQGLSGWLKDEDALFQYINKTSRYLEMSRLRPKLQGVRSWIETNLPDSSTLRQWKNYEDKVEGRPDNLTRAVNDWVVKKGYRSDVVQRSTGFIRGAESLAKLGFSPASALTNTSQYWLNTLPVLNGKYAWKGFKGATETFTASVLKKHGMGDIVPKGIKDYSWLLDELNIGSEAHKGDVLSQADRFRLYLPKNERERPQYWLNAVNHFGLWMFSNAEYLNRAGTVIGAYEKGIARGLSKQQAIRKAREVEVRTQFTYGAADAPMVLNNPWTKTAFQFQNYFLKQMEFMLGTAFGKSQYGRFDSRRQELGRMLGATLMATGAVGIPGVETLDALIDGATGYSFLDELNKSESPLLRNASRGLPGLIGQINPKLSGIDLSRSIGYGDFFSTSKLIPKFGPAVNEAILLLGAVAADPGLETDTKVKDLLSKISPQGRRIVESFMKDSAQDGQVLDAKGRLVMKDLKPFEEWAMRIGFSPVGIAEERERYMRDQELVRRAQSKRGGYIQVISDAIKRGDSEYAERMAGEAAAAGYPGLWGASMKQARTPTQTRSELYQRRFRRSLRTPPAAAPAPPAAAAPPSRPGTASTTQWGDW